MSTLRHFITIGYYYKHMMPCLPLTRGTKVNIGLQIAQFNFPGGEGAVVELVAKEIVEPVRSIAVAGR